MELTFEQKIHLMDQLFKMGHDKAEIILTLHCIENSKCYSIAVAVLQAHQTLKMDLK